MPQTVDLDTDLIRLEIDEDGVATLWIDDPDASVNKISGETLDAFTQALDALDDRGDVTGLVFISAKEESFIVGADLDMLRAFESPSDVRALSQRAHRLLRRVQNLNVPTVAAINGPCMGGGLEMTMGCDYRIASTHDATRLALPEVKLGLLPGGGGTQFLPRLVGVQQALTMMLTGKNTYPKKARKIGLVDALIHAPGLHGAARRAVLQLANGDLSVDRSGRPLGEKLIESTALSRRVLYQQVEKRTRARTKGNYPAPPRIIDAVRTGMESGLDAGLDTEMKHFADLVFTPESKALVSLFFARQERSDNPLEEKAHDVQSVGILGAGLMGGGIADVTAENGVNVILKDQTLELAAGGKKQVWSSLDKKRKKGILNRFERDKAAERVVPTASYDPMAHCDVVIEAIPEDLDLKHQVLSDVEDVVSTDTVLATNTSSIPIAQIAEGVDHPERVLGMHYFSPVSDVPLVELITTDQTSEEALATAYDLGLAQDKTVIVVNDGPGFYTTRILALYANEALLMFEEGADVEAVDEIMTDFGFPMGPYELLDFVGMDVAGKITKVMDAELPLEHVNISTTAQELADADLLGQKTDAGFYLYEASDDGAGKDRTDVNEAIYRRTGQTSRHTPPVDVVQDRLALMMVNEAVRCLEDNILRTPSDGDVGAVFGLGFPPFLGGPFRYIDETGADQIVRRMRDLQDAAGSRFEPADRLVEHAENGASFFE